MNYFDELSALVAQFQQLYSQWAKSHNLTLNELRFLYHLGRFSQARLSELGEKWSLPKQTVTSLCQQLAQKGYLQLLPDTADKRGKILQLTAAGKKFTAPLIADLTAIELATSAQFGDEKLAELNRAFSALLRHFAENLQPQTTQKEPQ